LVLSLTHHASQTQTKDLEEILHSIHERLAAIQVQMEETRTSQASLEARNESLHSTDTLLIDQVSSIPHLKNLF